MVQVVLTWRYCLSGLVRVQLSMPTKPRTWVARNGGSSMQASTASVHTPMHHPTVAPPPIEFLISVRHVRWVSNLTTCPLPSRCEGRRTR